MKRLFPLLLVLLATVVVPAAHAAQATLAGVGRPPFSQGIQTPPCLQPNGTLNAI